MTDKYAVKMSLLSLKGDKQLPLEYESPCHSPKIFLLATSLSYESMKLQSFINIELHFCDNEREESLGNNWQANGGDPV